MIVTYLAKQQRQIQWLFIHVKIYLPSVHIRKAFGFFYVSWSSLLLKSNLLYCSMHVGGMLEKHSRRPQQQTTNHLFVSKPQLSVSRFCFGWCVGSFFVSHWSMFNFKPYCIIVLGLTWCVSWMTNIDELMLRYECTFCLFCFYCFSCNLSDLRFGSLALYV